MSAFLALFGAMLTLICQESLASVSKGVWWQDIVHGATLKVGEVRK